MVTLVVALVGALGVGCQRDALPKESRASQSASAGDATPEATPTEADFRAAEAEAARFDGDGKGVALRGRAARLAAALYRESGDDKWWRAAHAQWVEASRRRGLPGACEASLELARHEATRPEGMQDAFLAAYRTARRFGDNPADGRCVDEARRLGRLLAAFRPSDEQLAAIDRDPHAGDPSAGLERFRGAEGPAATDLTGWLGAESSAEGAGEVTGVAVYDGADEALGDRARVVFALSGLARFQIKRTAVGPVIFIEDAGGGARARAPLTHIVGRAGVDRVLVEAGAGTTISFQGDAGVELQGFMLPDPPRLVADLRRPEAGASKRGGVRVIVLDAGHGGDDHGARYGGLRESRTALDITRRVGGILERRLPDARVLQTRTKDEFLSLEGRVAFANAVGADAFVSIHLNAGEGVEEGGVATFVLDTTDDRQALRLAARENGTSAKDVTGLQRILAGIYRKDQVDDAKHLASLVQTGTLAAARMHLPKLPDRGVKSAVFYVLVGALMPAVLVEASFINEPLENEKLKTEAYRQSLAEGIAEGIVRYANAAAAR